MASAFHRLNVALRRIGDDIEREMRSPAPSALRLLRLRSLKIAISRHIARRLYRRALV